MKKRLLSIIVVAIMMISTMPTAFAAEVTNNEDIQQTFETIFDFLNDQDIQLGGMESVEYEIPVGENIVSVTVENTPAIMPLDTVYGDDSYFDIERGKSYIITTTIRNFFKGSGEIVFRVYYDCWGDDNPNKVKYRITPTNITINVASPSGCTLTNSTASYDPNYTITNLILAYGSADFERTWPLSDVNFSMKVTIVAYEEGYVLCRYQYDV